MHPHLSFFCGSLWESACLESARPPHLGNSVSTFCCFDGVFTPFICRTHMQTVMLLRAMCLGADSVCCISFSLFLLLSLQLTVVRDDRCNADTTRWLMEQRGRGRWRRAPQGQFQQACLSPSSHVIEAITLPLLFCHEQHASVGDLCH